MKKSLTIIVPVFNEEKTIPLFFARLKIVIQKLNDRYDIKILFINNSSIDNTYNTVLELRSLYQNVNLITLSKNVGYQKSLECGLDNVESDLLVFIDVDGEDPPEMILDFVKYFEIGYDIVYGERVDRHESFLLKKLRNVFYQIARRLADEEILLYMAEFSLITKEVRDAIVGGNNTFPFIRNLIARVGFSRLGIPYKRQIRIEGKTNYNLWGMFLFAASGILSSSTFFLRAPIYLFPFWFMTLIALVLDYIFSQNINVLLFIFVLSMGYIGLTISFIAIYVARIYKNGLGFSNYTIYKKYTFLD
jgi:dolichol-phosphate mannosyltransferase